MGNSGSTVRRRAEVPALAKHEEAPTVVGQQGDSGEDEKRWKKPGTESSPQPSLQPPREVAWPTSTVEVVVYYPKYLRETNFNNGGFESFLFAMQAVSS